MCSFLEIVDAHYYYGKHIVEAINGITFALWFNSILRLLYFAKRYLY